MESGTNKIKVVWICHFSNYKIQKRLKVRKKIKEFAPWITLGINEAKRRKNIELHVISPHKYITGLKEFKEDNVNYHFFNPGIPFFGRHWPAILRMDLYTDYWYNKGVVKLFVHKIKPDIIHLHGLENPYYSSTVIQFIGKYPLFATIQGFATLPLDSKKKLSKNLKKRGKVERILLNRVSNFGVRTEEMMKRVQKFNKSAVFYWHEYFLNIPIQANERNNNSVKKYDIVFFARITKAKGIEDLIVSIGAIKKNLNDIRVAVIGSTSTNYLKFLKRLAEKNNCLSNIDFIGFMPTQNDVFNVLKASRVCVLPTYNDIIPGTIIESMFRKIPVVSYKTGGIPDINQKEEIVLLSEQGDIDGLVTNILKLLHNDKYSEELTEKAYKYAIGRWSNEKAMDDIITAYKTILSKV